MRINQRRRNGQAVDVRQILGAALAVALLIVLLATLVSLRFSASGRGYMDTIRDEAILDTEFGFMTEVERKERPGNSGGKARPDEVLRSFTITEGTAEDAVAQVITVAQEDGWEPDPGSAPESDSQRKVLSDGRTMRLRCFAAEDRLYLVVAAPA